MKKIFFCILFLYILLIVKQANADENPCIDNTEWTPEQGFPIGTLGNSDNIMWGHCNFKWRQSYANPDQHYDVYIDSYSNHAIPAHFQVSELSFFPLMLFRISDFIANNDHVSYAHRYITYWFTRPCFNHTACIIRLADGDQNCCSSQECSYFYSDYIFTHTDGHKYMIRNTGSNTCGYRCCSETYKVRYNNGDGGEGYNFQTDFMIAVEEITYNTPSPCEPVGISLLNCKNQTIIPCGDQDCFFNRPF